ncbi:hypothetical protein [Paenibacillus sp. MMS20-IR301]|nr:hypothetical protein [Paenibacillus sp. MMS20-IR301]WNS40764.1 hypothetical protein LOS79_17035 [Paenibacillus sp. MMS20-IR301]
MKKWLFAIALFATLGYILITCLYLPLTHNGQAGQDTVVQAQGNRQ